MQTLLGAFMRVHAADISVRILCNDSKAEVKNNFSHERPFSSFTSEHVGKIWLNTLKCATQVKYFSSRHTIPTDLDVTWVRVQSEGPLILRVLTLLQIKCQECVVLNLSREIIPYT